MLRVSPRTWHAGCVSWLGSPESRAYDSGAGLPGRCPLQGRGKDNKTEKAEMPKQVYQCVGYCCGQLGLGPARDSCRTSLRLDL